MKHWINAIPILALLTLPGCLDVKPVARPSDQPAKTVGNTIGLQDVQKVRFEGRYNAELLLDSVRDMELKFIEKSLLKRKDHILIGSIETPADSERSFPVGKKDPIVTFIEDALTLKLTENDFQVVERDSDVLTRIYHESGKKYRISIGPDFQPEKALAEFIKMLEDKESALGGSVNEVIIRGIIRGLIPSNRDYAHYPFDGKKPFQTSSSIKAASHILSFRVLECGFLYKPVEVDGSGGYDEVDRVAMTKLHLRLTNQQGVTIWSDIVSGKASEITPVRMIPFAESPNLKFVGFSTPVKEFVYDMYKSDGIGNQSSKKAEPQGLMKKPIKTVKGIFGKK